MTINVFEKGQKIAEVRPAAGGYTVFMQAGGTGFDCPLPDLFPSPGAAIDAVRDAHRADGDRADDWAGG